MKFLCLFVSAVLVCVAIPVQAQTPTTWISTGNTSTSNITNWSGGAVPGTSNVAVFDGTSTTNPTGALAVEGLSFTGGNYTLTLPTHTSPSVGTSGISVSGSGTTATITGASAFTISSSQTWTSTNVGDSLSVSSVRYSLAANSIVLTLTGAGNFTLGGDSLASNVNPAFIALSDTGTTTFSGSINTSGYGGGTTINSGTLLVDASYSGLLTVNSGGTLGGNGTINTATTIVSGATLAPGNSVGLLTFGSTLALNSGSTTSIQINGAVRGTSYSAVNVTGATTYGGSLALSTGSSIASGTTVDLFGLAGGSSGDFDSVFSTGYYDGSFTDTSGVWTLLSQGQLLTFTDSTGDLTFAASDLDVVPEPASYAGLAGLVALGYVGSIQRRKSLVKQSAR